MYFGFLLIILLQPYQQVWVQVKPKSPAGNPVPLSQVCGYLHQSFNSSHSQLPPIFNAPHPYLTFVNAQNTKACFFNIVFLFTLVFDCRLGSSLSLRILQLVKAQKTSQPHMTHSSAPATTNPSPPCWGLKQHVKTHHCLCMYFCFFIYFNFNFFNFFKFFLVLLGHPHTTCPFPLLMTHINISGLKWCIKLHHLSLGMFLFIYSSSIYHSFIFLFIFVLLTSHPFCTPTCTSQDTPPSSQGPKQCIKHVVWASGMFFYLFLFDDFLWFF